MAAIEARVYPLTEPGDRSMLRHVVHWALFVPDGEVAPPLSAVDDAALRPYWVDFGERPGDEGRGVTWHGEFVGAAYVRQMVGYGHVDDDTPELTIALHPAWRGGGLGGRLLGSLFESVPRCSLSVDERNPAVRLYRRWGFVEVRRDGEHSLVMLRDERSVLGK